MPETYYCAGFIFKMLVKISELVRLFHGFGITVSWGVCVCTLYSIVIINVVKDQLSLLRKVIGDKIRFFINCERKVHPLALGG